MNQLLNQTVDITPSPRVLRMLGQIDFKPWQCLAELIDNSIDSFLDQTYQGKPIPSPRVTIQLPSDAELQNGTGKLTIKDNGSGMSLEQLQNAVRAGYSGNDPVEKMGLFGMGFNISTARLGRHTQVWTTTSEAVEWIGVDIDFDQLERDRTFKAPLLTRKKNEYELETKYHGTEVLITKLEPDRVRSITRGAGKLKTFNKLGKIYGRVMAALGVSIVFAGDMVTPWRHCTWDKKRSVPTKNFGNVPAIIEIDEELEARKYCTTCWVWLNDGETECPSCGLESNLIERQRHLKGWIGVQRYFDQNHYGIDLIRNGRVIEELNKSLFYFENNQGERDLEYPVDATHWGGRIVGELEIDFVRVSHQKDSFDKLDPEWKRVIELIRGNSPLRPQIAKRMGLAQNTSPLAVLYAGYHAGHAGLKELVPGDISGRGINEIFISDWIPRFYSGETEYQSDEKWYQLVLQAEEANRGGSSGGKEAAGELPTQAPSSTEKNSEDTLTKNGSITSSPIIETFELDPILSGTYELKIGQVPIAVKVRVRKFTGQNMEEPFYIKATGLNFEFDYNPNHSFFEESLDLPVDALLIDLSHHFLALSAQSPREWPVSVIERRLRAQYFPESLTNISRSAEMASALLLELREHLDGKLSDIAPIDPDQFDEESIRKIQRRALQMDNGNKEFVNEALRTGRFIKYVDNKFLINIIELWPKLVMDNNFFSTPYDGLSPDLKRDALQMLVTGIEDVWWLSGDGRDAMSKDIAWRLRYSRALASMQLVQSWRS